MKKYYFIFSVMLISSIVYTKKLHFPGHTLPYFYQDIIINNKVVSNGVGPNCKTRYNEIKKILKEFKRPITVLDIGPGEGYMSLRIAYEFDSTCVMIADPQYEGKILPKLCKLNTELNNIILLHKRISAQELEHLSKCEHFDVVLALNVLHHFPIDQWENAAKAILNLGDHIIVETPPVEDKKSLGQATLPGIITFLENNNGRIIAKTRRIHTYPNNPNICANMYLLKGNKTSKHLSWLDDSENRYEVETSLHESSYIYTKNDIIYKSSKPIGINLVTFNMLNGIYPNKEIVEKNFASLQNKLEKTLYPQHAILQGENICTISIGN